MKIYKANRKGFFKYMLFGFLIFPAVIFLFFGEVYIEKPIIVLFLLVPFFLLLWIYLDTYYKIENDKLIYHSGFLRGKIEISKIKEIIKGKTMWSGIKPALARNGLIIKFNNYNEIYIAPVNNNELISDLLSVNSEINITE